MKNPFKIGKSYSIRHKILKVLYDDWLSNGEVDRIIGSIKIANTANIPIADIHRWQGLLVEKGEITSADNDGQKMISIQLAGRNAYLQSKYLQEGRKERWDNVWDWARIVIPLGALLLSIINYVSNRSLNERVNKLEQKIENKK